MTWMTRMTRMTRMIWMTRGLLQPPAAGRRLTGASQSGPDWSGPELPGRVGNLARYDGAGARRRGSKARGSPANLTSFVLVTVMSASRRQGTASEHGVAVPVTPRPCGVRVAAGSSRGSPRVRRGLEPSGPEARPGGILGGWAIVHVRPTRISVRLGRFDRLGRIIWNLEGWDVLYNILFSYIANILQHNRNLFIYIAFILI